MNSLMSPYVFWNSGASIIYVNGSNLGYLDSAYVHSTNGVVRPKFLFDKFFHNKYYGRKSLRETNIIQSLKAKY